jgi:hypothetical protein
MKLYLLLIDFTEFLQLETVVFAQVNTLSCAILIFIICLLLLSVCVIRDNSVV